MSQMDTATVPKKMLVDHIVAEARESNNWEEHIGTPRGVDTDVEYNLSDIDNWDVDHHSDGRISLFGTTTGEYSVQVRSATMNPPGKAHPAEYETRTVEIGVEIIADYNKHDGLGEYQARVEGL